jgi:predicted flap endonuclease-1-like 5' DNA nuclease
VSTASLMYLGMLLAGLVTGLVVGGIVGGVLSRSERSFEDATDWRVRMAARDRDLLDATNRLADAQLELQSLRDRLGGARHPDPLADAQIAALTEELRLADDELTRLRSLGLDRSPAAPSGIAQRLEALEVELATLASMRCPDPSAHRGTGSFRRRPSLRVDIESDPDGDDLTRIVGVGPGLAAVFRRMGYRTFADVARLDDGALEEIARIAGDVAGPSAREGWVQSARRLASHTAA